VSDTYMAPPAAEDLIEALAACLREHVEERKRELALAQENLAKAKRVLEAFRGALDSGSSVAERLYDSWNANQPVRDLSAVADEELVREYLRLLDMLVNSTYISPVVGASYDDHWNELERRGFTVRKAELERWLQEHVTS